MNTDRFQASSAALGVALYRQQDNTSPLKEIVDSSPWMTVAETAELFGLHVHTVYRHLQNGTFFINAARFGRRWRISRTHADAVLDEIAEMLSLDPAEVQRITYP